MSKSLNSEEVRTEIALFRYTLILPILRQSSPQAKHQLRNLRHCRNGSRHSSL